jgi:hypothetical protein
MTYGFDQFMGKFVEPCAKIGRLFELNQAASKKRQIDFRPQQTAPD